MKERVLVSRAGSTREEAEAEAGFEGLIVSER